MRIFISAAIACVCATAELTAQERTIPRDLVLGLLSNQFQLDGKRTPNVLVGQAPKDWPLLPNIDLPVMGSAGHDNTLLVVYRITGEPNVAMRRAREIMKAEGWKSSHGPELPDVGFVGTEPEMVEHLDYCRGDNMAFIQSAKIRADLQILKLSIHRQTDSPECGQGWVQYDTYFPVAGGSGVLYALEGKMPMPKLEPPAGARVAGGGIVPGPYRLSSSAILTTRLSTAEVMAHYAAQMHTKGWSSRGSADGEFTKVHTWRMTLDGKELLASLIATQLPENQQVIELSIYALSGS